MKKNNKEKLDELEQEIREEFINLSEQVQNFSQTQLEKKNKESINASYNTRGIGNDIVKAVFNDKMEPKKIHTQMNMNHCIKIKGNLNSVNFMNQLCYMIDNKFETCFIEPVKKNLNLKLLLTKKKKKKKI